MFKKLTFVSLFFFLLLATVAGQSYSKLPLLLDSITDRNIQSPDIDYSLEHALTDWKSSFFQSPLCPQFAQGDVFYPDSTYINRLYAYPSEIELSYNSVVREYINKYTSKYRSSVQYLLAKGQFYFPMIEDILDKYGLPLELRYVPVIESALNPSAVSRAGATGLWQFMLRTGKMYDLEVNSLVDERRDPVKATEAAARHLKDLYDIYDDWNLVIAAYNCGTGNVQKAISRSGGLKDYWAIYPYLPRETRGYVPAFIAATYVMNYYSKHNICPAEYSYPVSVDTVMINKTLHLQQIADVLHLSMDEIRSLNPQYKKDIIPGDYKCYPLCLPSKSISEFIVNSDTIFAYKSQLFLTHRKTVEIDERFASAGKATRSHKVRRGETLGAIAGKYGVTVAQIKRLNNLRSNNITAGKLLVISRAAVPVKTAAPAAEQPQELAANSIAASKPENNGAATQTAAADNFFANYYKSHKQEVAAGETDAAELLPASETDTLLIAGTEGTDRGEKREYRDKDDNRTIYHKVKTGETLSTIAEKYGVSAVEIIAWNKLAAKKAITGQRLMIKLPEKNVVPDETELLADTVSGNKSPQIAVIPEQVQPVEKLASEIAVRAKTYYVKKGDSLSVIAKRYGSVTAEDIMLANNLKDDKLSIGQKLKIPVN